MKKGLIALFCICTLLSTTSCDLFKNDNNNIDDVESDNNEDEGTEPQNGILKYLGNKYEIYELNKEYEFNFDVSSFLKEKLVYEIGNKKIIELNDNGKIITKSTGITYIRIYNSEYREYEFKIPVYVFEQINKGNISDLLASPLYTMYEVTGRLENVNNYINKKEATLIDENNISYDILLSDNPKECITTKQDAFNVSGHIRLVDNIESTDALKQLKNGDVIKVLLMGEEATVFGKKDYKGVALLLDVMSQENDTECIINNKATHLEVSTNMLKYNDLFKVKCLTSDIEYIRAIGTHGGLLNISCEPLDEEYSLLTYICESQEITIYDTRFTLFDTHIGTFTTRFNVTGQDNPTINKESIHSILFDNCDNTLLDANKINILNYYQVSGLTNKGLNIGISNSMTRSYVSFSIPVDFKIHSVSVEVISMETSSSRRSDIVINNIKLGSVYGFNLDSDGKTFKYISNLPITHISIASGSVDNDSYGFAIRSITFDTLHFTQFDD